MPEDRKSSRSRKPTSSRTGSTAGRKPAARPSRSRARAQEPLEPEETSGSGAELDDEEEDLDAMEGSIARPVPVGVGRTRSTMDEAAGDDDGIGDIERAFETDEATSVLTEERTHVTEGAVERPMIEAAVGVVAAALALSVLLLDWYTTTVTGVATGISGWASGTWGPVVFFLALAVVAIVVMRFARIPVSFPFETATIVEAVGWISVGGLIVKRWFHPEVWAPQQWPWFVSIILAAALFLLAGMMSRGAPFVLRPGWFKDKPGKIGAATLGIAVVAGAFFGLTNNPPGPRECPTDFPPVQGVTIRRPTALTPTICSMDGTAPMSAPNLYKRFSAALKAKEWKHNAGAKLDGGQRVIQIVDEDRCGFVLVAPIPGKPKLSSFRIMVGAPEDIGVCQSLSQFGGGGRK